MPVHMSFRIANKTHPEGYEINARIGVALHHFYVGENAIFVDIQHVRAVKCFLGSLYCIFLIQDS